MIHLLFQNLRASAGRSFFTVLSIALALVLIATFRTALAVMGSTEGAVDGRVVVRHAMSLMFSLPEAYYERLQSIPGVVAATPQTWFGGEYKDARPENFFARFSTDPGSLFDVYPEFEISQEEVANWRANRSGAIAGQALVDRFGWKIGDRIVVRGDIYPIDLDVVLSGIYKVASVPQQEKQLFFHHKYLDAAMNEMGKMGSFLLRLDTPDSVPRVVQTTEAMFENSTAPVRAETEKAFQLSFLEMMGNVQLFLGAIGAAVAVSVLLIVANTLAMAARERIRDVAVLRTLGFSPRSVFGLVMGEALLLGLSGAVLAISMAHFFLPAFGAVGADFMPDLGSMGISVELALQMIAAGLVVGVVAGTFPAAQAMRLHVVDALRRVE